MSDTAPRSNGASVSSVGAGVGDDVGVGTVVDGGDGEGAGVGDGVGSVVDGGG